MGKKEYTPDDFRNFRNTEKVLRENNCPIVNCNGSHVKGYLPNGTVLVYPSHNTGTGLAHKIWKILKSAGLLGILIFSILIGMGII